ncbi:hypothetical protein [Pedobacter yulinensis]|nr:hypothetical protein [Pedobacter yulinensis]
MQYPDQQNAENEGVKPDSTEQNAAAQQGTPAGEWDSETEFEELNQDQGNTTVAGAQESGVTPTDSPGVADQDGSPLLTLGDTEPFEIQVVEDKIRVEPQNNGTYRIFLHGEKIAVIYPQSSGDQVVWETLDSIEDGFLQQIGELITEHHMH